MEFDTVTSKVDVMLVDYGEIITTTVSQLYPMQIQYCQEPAHGLLCCVHDLEPANQIWDLESIVYFNQSCENITATFHPPPKEHVNTDTFSIYFPDYYVSLQKRNCNENADIRLAMVNKVMGISSHPPKSSQALQNSSLESSLLRNSLKETDPKSLASNKSSCKTVEEYETPGSSEGKPSALNDLIVDSSKIYVIDQSNSKNSSLKSGNNFLLTDTHQSSFPNTNAKEFISLKNSTSIPSVASQQHSICNIQSNRPLQDENLTDVNLISRSSSANVGQSSSSTNQGTKIRAVPLNGFATFPVTNNLADDIDDLLLIPHASRAVPTHRTESPVSPYDSGIN